METCETTSSISSSIKMIMSARKSTRKRKTVNPAEREAESTQPLKTRKSRQTAEKPFSCDYCKSRFVVNPVRRKPGQKSKGTATPRYKIDPQTHERLALCNTCGLQFDRKTKPRPRDPPPSEEDKKRYYEGAQHFAASLVEGLREPDAEKLICPVYNTKPCGCIQKFIIGEGAGDREQSKTRALHLLDILKNAKQLREKKFYNREEVLSKGKGQRKVGLGNGHRKSKEYEEFVLSTRKVLRNEHRMCERATQRILHYSNNFLHKRLKTDPLNRTQRLQRTKGQAALGKLVTISDMTEQTCCAEKCVMMARTHSLLLKQWRERATTGQAEARKVLAEMLTPSGQSSNCPKFIGMVTGSSLTTIARVKEQMWKTGGDREPPQHGLRRYWKNHPRRKASLLEEEEEEGGNASGSGPGTSDASGGPAGAQTSLLTVAQLREQQEQLKRLQQQLEEQQHQVRQQQRLVEQQLVQHQLRQRRQLRQQAAIAEAQRKVLQQRTGVKAKAIGSASTVVSSGPRLSTENMSTASEATPSNVALQPATVYQQSRISLQPPISVNQQLHASVVTQAQPVHHPIPTIVGMNIEQQAQPQQVVQEQAQTPLPRPQQQQLTATVAGLEGVDSKLLQHNLQQLLVEIQNQMVTQQLQQQLISCGVQGPSTSVQPPSYSTAVAATNQVQVVQTQQQQQKQTKDGTQQTQVIIQTIPGIQPSTAALLVNSSDNTVGESKSGGCTQHFISSQTSISLPRSKTTENPPVIFPITFHPTVSQGVNEEAINVEDVNVQLQEVVMPLEPQGGSGDNVVLPCQQLPSILQAPVQQHPASLSQLTRHPNLSSHDTRPTAAISIESLCNSRQHSPGNMGDLVVAESESIPLVGGVSVETLLSPETLQILGTAGPSALNVSLSATRAKSSTPGSGDA